MNQEMGPQKQLDTYKMERQGLASFSLRVRDFSQHRTQFESPGQGGSQMLVLEMLIYYQSRF